MLLYILQSFLQCFALVKIWKFYSLWCLHRENPSNLFFLSLSEKLIYLSLKQMFSFHHVKLSTEGNIAQLLISLKGLYDVWKCIEMLKIAGFGLCKACDSLIQLLIGERRLCINAFEWNYMLHLNGTLWCAVWCSSHWSCRLKRSANSLGLALRKLWITSL